MDAERAKTRAARLARRLAWRLLGVWWWVRRPDTNGVKLLVRCGDHLVFVRHAYGRRDLWELPGGGRRRRESAAGAARRETREELGLELPRWATLGELVVTDRATAHLTCLGTRVPGRHLAPALGELEETRWARWDAPPTPLGPHAAAALALPGVVRWLSHPDPEENPV